MNRIISLVGAVVIVLFVMGYLGLRWTRLKLGDLSVSVHSEANNGGETRAQLTP